MIDSKKKIASSPATFGGEAPRNDGEMDSRPSTSLRTRFRGNDSNDPDIQKLLDVVSEIIANEYIEVAKKHRDIFCKGETECK